MKLLIKTTIVLLIVAFASLSAYATQYKYDELNRLIEVTYKSGQTVTYTYDEGGNILSVKVNAPVTLEPIGNKKVDAGKLLEFTIIGSTEEGADLEFSAYNLPEGAEFDVATNTFKWTPNVSQVGVHRDITFKVTSGDYVASESISITVEGSLNTLPGENVEIVLERNSSVTFENVTQAGETTMSIHNNLPDGTSVDVNLIPVYYDITTTAKFEGTATIRIYSNIAGFEEFIEDLRLYQIKNGNVIDITVGAFKSLTGTSTGYIEGIIEHFCYFAVGIPNRAPIANAGVDKIVEATSPDGAEVLLDGSLSFDPDSELEEFVAPNTINDGRNIVSYKWDGIFGEAQGISPTVTLPIGTWNVKLTVSDGLLSSTDEVNITVKEKVQSVVYGDLNGDGAINSIDLVLLRRFILGIITEFPVENGDVISDLNGDGKIDSTDYVLLKRYVLRIINKFPVEDM